MLDQNMLNTTTAGLALIVAAAVALVCGMAWKLRSKTKNPSDRSDPVVVGGSAVPREAAQAEAAARVNWRGRKK